MLLLELYQSLILEHNVVNGDAISKYVEQFAQGCDNDNAKEWFRTVLSKNLERNDEINVPMTSTNIPRNAPDWLEDAVERGDDLRVFSAPDHMNAMFDHVVDYMNHLNAVADPVINNLERLMKVSVENAVKKSEEWVASGARAASRIAVSGVKVVDQDGGFTWVEPETFEAYQRDGAILHHCTATGTYDKEFKNKSMQFYFLHDSKGQPHVCLSTRGDSLDQVKGKQNQPPVGRYAQLCANFLNKLKLSNSSENYDVRQMGLITDDKGQLTTISQTGEMVFRIGKVRVYKIDGAMMSMQNQYGELKKSVKGVEYWFNSQEGDLFKITVSDAGFAYMKGVQDHDHDRDRELVQQFLNTYFPETAPPPMETYYSSSTKNDITYSLMLQYDYLSKKYGTAEEISEKKTTIDGYDCYVRGEKNYNQIKTVLVIFKDNDEICSIPLHDKLGQIDWYVGHHEEAFAPQHRNILLKLANYLALPPEKDLFEDAVGFAVNWRWRYSIYYNREKKQYGDFDICKKVWSKGQYSLYLRDEIETHQSYMMIKSGETLPFFELGHGGKIRILDTDKAKLIAKPLLAVLNECQELEWIKSTDISYDSYNIFYGNGKWQTREEAADLFHKFDDGFYFTVIDNSPVKIYNLYDGKDVPLLDMSFKNSTIYGYTQLGESSIRTSRYFLWLLNNIEAGEKNVVDADKGWQNTATPTVNAFLWRMGLFHDTRSESWKLVQDGKLVYSGKDYRAINFRNRIFIVDNDDGCVGWFKKGGTGNIIEDEHAFDPHTLADLYHYLVDLCDNTDFILQPKRHISTGSTRLPNSQLRKMGFTHDKNHRFTSIEALHPTETIMELPKGYSWIRKANDENFAYQEKDEPLHHERYSLTNAEGKSFMRVEFDDDHLTGVWFSEKDSFGSQLSKNLEKMPDSQKKALLSLMEKLNRKFTPGQASKIGYYRTKSGSFKSLNGNKTLEGYLKGEIDFGDGHIFQKGRHNDEWTLGLTIPEPDADQPYPWSRHGTFRPYLKITLDDEGIDSVKYLRKEIKRHPNEYMPYIQKLMKIFAMIAGE